MSIFSQVQTVSNSGFRSPRLAVAAAILGASTSLLVGTGATAAESVTLKYNSDTVTVTLPEMQSFAQSGQLTPALQTFFHTTQKVPTQWSELLTKEIKIPYFIERLIHSPKGRFVLHQIDEMVYESGSKGLEDLDKAVTKAMADGNISVIEVIRDYPASTINIDLKVVETDYNQIKQLAEGIEKGDSTTPAPDFLKGILCHCQTAQNNATSQTQLPSAQLTASKPIACHLPLVQK